MESFLAQKKDLKDTAQRAFIAYIKSVVLMKNKNVFKVDALNLDALARSLGLVITPRVRFLDRLNKRKKKSSSKTEFNFETEGEEPKAAVVPAGTNGLNKVTQFESGDEEEEEVVEKKKTNSESDGDSSSSESDDEFMTVKRKDHAIEAEDSEGPEEESILYQPQSNKKLQAKPLTKASLAKKVLKKKIVANKKIQFNEEGEAQADPTKQLQSELGRAYEEGDDDDEGGGINIERAKQLMREEDKFDKARFKELVKARKEMKKEKRLAKEKKRKQQQQEDGEGDSDEEQEMDDFGSDDDGDEPDLSWLPDPDKIYGRGSDSGDGNEEDEEEEVFHRPPEKLVEKKTKRKKEEEAEVVTKPPKSKRQKPNLAEDLSLNEAEAIALKLLGS